MMSKVFKYNRFSIASGTEIDRPTFIKSVIKGGYRGDINKAWDEYSKTLPKPEPKKTERTKKSSKKEDNS